MSRSLLRGIGNRLGPPVFFPLQLSNKVRGVSGFEATPSEPKMFTNEFELSGEHLLLLYELTEEVVVLAIAGDVGDDAEVVSEVGGVTKLFKAGAPTDEHVVEPGGEGNW